MLCNLQSNSLACYPTEGTMEHTAVQLMSRKQRAAKILTGDTGLTGLDALTEGEGGFEAALLNAITETDDLIDPRDLFTQDAVDDEITSEDNAFWNVEVDEDDDANQTLRTFDPAILEEVADDTRIAIDVPETQSTLVPVHVPVVSPTATTAQRQLAELIVSDDELDDILASLNTPQEAPVTAEDDLVTFAIEELGGTLREEEPPENAIATRAITPPEYLKQMQYVDQYLAQFPTTKAQGKWTIELLTLIRDGEWDDKEDVQKVAGIEDDYFLTSESMQKALHRRVKVRLKKRRLVPYDDVSEAARHVIELSLMALGKIPIQLDIFAALRVNKQQEIARRAKKNHASSPPAKSSNSKRRKTKLDLMAVPTDVPEDEKSSPQARSAATEYEEEQPKQLAFF